MIGVDSYTTSTPVAEFATEAQFRALGASAPLLSIVAAASAGSACHLLRTTGRIMTADIVQALVLILVTIVYF